MRGSPTTRREPTQTQHANSTQKCLLLTVTKLPKLFRTLVTTAPLISAVGSPAENPSLFFFFIIHNRLPTEVGLSILFHKDRQVFLRPFRGPDVRLSKDIGWRCCWRGGGFEEHHAGCGALQEIKAEVSPKGKWGNATCY